MKVGMQVPPTCRAPIQASVTMTHTTTTLRPRRSPRRLWLAGVADLAACGGGSGGAV